MVLGLFSTHCFGEPDCATGDEPELQPAKHVLSPLNHFSGLFSQFLTMHGHASSLHSSYTANSQSLWFLRLWKSLVLCFGCLSLTSAKLLESLNSKCK